MRQSLTTGARVNLGRRGMLVSAESDGERSIEVTVSPTARCQRQRSTARSIALRDVSDLRGLTRAMSYQASHDALTGLVNRREFERRLEEALEATPGGARHVLCYLDLDRFKAVNDECGHVAGDSMLREVAALIKDAVRDSDTVGRLGGDEFGVLLVGLPARKGAPDRRRRRARGQRPPLRLEGQDLQHRRQRRPGRGDARRARRSKTCCTPRTRPATSRRTRAATCTCTRRATKRRRASAARSSGCSCCSRRSRKTASSCTRSRSCTSTPQPQEGGPGLEVLLRLQGRQGRVDPAVRVHARRRALPPDAARRPLGRADVAHGARPRRRAPRARPQPVHQPLRPDAGRCGRSSSSSSTASTAPASRPSASASRSPRTR